MRTSSTGTPASDASVPEYQPRLINPTKTYQVAIDTLTYKFDVMREDPSDVTEGPDDGIYCHGLWLEGKSKLQTFFAFFRYDVIVYMTRIAQGPYTISPGCSPEARITCPPLSLCLGLPI